MNEKFKKGDKLVRMPEHYCADFPEGLVGEVLVAIQNTVVFKNFFGSWDANKFQLAEEWRVDARKSMEDHLEAMKNAKLN